MNLNLVVDWDLSGTFGNTLLEWAIVDAPLGPPGTATMQMSAAFPVLTAGPDPMAPGGWAVGPFWTRAMVSDEVIASVFAGGGWDGSGRAEGYVGGETEDWVVACDPGAGFHDCNRNGRPDEVDLYSGSSGDANRDGIPDECQSRPFRRSGRPSVTVTRQP